MKKNRKSVDLRTLTDEYIDQKYNEVLELVKSGYNIREAIRKSNISDVTFYKRVSAVKLAELKLIKKLNTDYSHRKLY